jgi:O-antigen/teichoic acid export membrane protein
MLRTLVKDSAVYAVGTIASRLVGFIMIPVYTRVLTPADYGIIETIVRLVDIIGLLLSLGLAQALLHDLAPDCGGRCHSRSQIGWG